MVDKTAHDIVGAVILFQRVPVPVAHDPVGFDPADRIFHTDPDLGLQPVDLLRCDSQLADSPQLGGRMAPAGSNITTTVLDYARIR